MSPRRPCFFFFFAVSFPFSFTQSNPQNLETFFPFPFLVPSPSASPNASSASPPPSLHISPSFPPVIDENSSADRTTVIKAVAATAVSTFVIATLLFFFVRRYIVKRRDGKIVNRDDERKISGRLQASGPAKGDRSLDGLIIDENGLDVLYWRKLQGKSKSSSSFRKLANPNSLGDDDQSALAKHQRRKSEPVQEIPLLRGRSSSGSDQNKVLHGASSPNTTVAQHVNQFEKLSQTSNSPPPATAPAPPPPPPPPPQSLMAIPAKKAPAPPPIPAKKAPAPPPGSVEKNNSNPPPPPPPPIMGKKSSAGPPPPPPPKAAGASKGMGAGSSGTQAGSSTGPVRTGSGNSQVKLKPLHWDKVNKNTDHSMVWDKIGGGSFKFDDDLMEALFGYVATNKRSPKKEGAASDSKSQGSSPTAKPITLLDARKSQNIAIVLKSLGISQRELLGALTEGHGLNADTLERLMRVAPNKEEETQILEFDGDSRRLADAESFLYHLLKAVPSAFSRIDAMFFRLNYDSEITQCKDILETLESGCKELRNRGLFVKLLEAVLKAGNRMNAGTSRGNAQAFNLTSLKKLSDVKSIDGKSTLLHFIVEEVVRAEGKRCVINRNRSMNRSGSRSSINSDNSTLNEEKEKEYMMLGLPMVGGLSAQFSSVKKAAQIDYDTFAGTQSGLTARAAEVREIASQCEEGGFAKEMKAFLETADEELNILKEEEKRVMELVRNTTEYYQTGASKNKGAQPLQLFVLIKDFLGMVDQVCIEIARNQQKRKTPSSSSGSSSASRTAVKFPNLPEHFMLEKSSSSSSESDAEM
ncbi:formin-like protein 8 [Mercurialis annua]|uniref:formin-like protein 8 n=1 Tax=Mercurialis annua TaxID=3986 RepID=UPI00215E66BE|nr:formin-like protein 8 [Mercurialis annua]